MINGYVESNISMPAMFNKIFRAKQLSQGLLGAGLGSIAGIGLGEASGINPALLAAVGGLSGAGVGALTVNRDKLLSSLKDQRTGLIMDRLSGSKSYFPGMVNHAKYSPWSNGLSMKSEMIPAGIGYGPAIGSSLLGAGIGTLMSDDDAKSKLLGAVAGGLAGAGAGKLLESRAPGAFNPQFLATDVGLYPPNIMERAL